MPTAQQMGESQLSSTLNNNKKLLLPCDIHLTILGALREIYK
jgi:hypothetical protein